MTNEQLQAQNQMLIKALKDIQAVQDNPYYGRYNEWLECVQDMNQIVSDVLKEIGE